MKDSLKIISTKLKVPVPRRDYIRRVSLLEKLKTFLDYKLTLVQGKAGSGKTTLLACFIQENPSIVFRWITLDSRDNNIFSFWYYLLKALKDYLKDEYENILLLFETAMHREDIERTIILLINQLNKQDDDIVIVLDDFHHIYDTNLVRTIEFFIRYLPDNVSYIVLTREEPSFYLGDLAVSNQLLEIGEEELKLTYAEGIDFLKQTLKMQQDDEIVSQISMLSEGWIGGLQLVGLAFSNNENTSIDSIKVLNKYVIDYLSKEILNVLGEDEREFLIKTSILNYFNEEICNRLLDIQTSKQLITDMIERNLFIIAMDGDNYRYHNMFEEFLRLEFASLDFQMKKALHIRASKIYENLGDLEEAIAHLLQIPDYGAALKLIQNIDHKPLAWTYLSQIPLENVLTDREMTFHLFFYYFCNLQLDKCDEVLKYAQKKIENDRDCRIFEFARALIEEDNITTDNITTDIMTIDEIEKMTIDDTTKAIIYLNLSMFLNLQEQYDMALQFINRAMSIEDSIENPYIKYFAYSLKAQVKEQLGELSECMVLYKKLYDMLRQYPLLSPLTFNTYIGEAGIYLKRLELDRAEQTLYRAEEMSASSYAPLRRGYLYNLMELNVLKGRNKEAIKLIQELMSSSMYEDDAYVSSLLKYLLYLEAVEKGMIDNFMEVCENQLHENKMRKEDMITYSRVLFLQGQDEKALEMVDKILKFARRNKISTYIVEATLLKIKILNVNFASNRREILNLFREAIHYSYGNKIILPFILEGNTVKPLIETIQNENYGELGVRERQFLIELQALFNADKKDLLLTDREMEVLMALATGATNREIGNLLCISTSTVKTHLINIYSKLYVSNRVEAIEKARQKGIIDT